MEVPARSAPDLYRNCPTAPSTAATRNRIIESGGVGGAGGMGPSNLFLPILTVTNANLYIVHQSMKSYELRYILLEPCLPLLNSRVRAVLKRAVAASSARPFRLLDVGGRTSPYTIGVPARVTVSDLPRQSDLQRQLNLGFTDSMVTKLQNRRSNVEAVVYDDMTRTALPPASFDGIVAVEVLEHVEEDERFVQQVAQTLKPGGCFVMTTPNGESIANKNPDHKRHYTRAQLEGLLKPHFSQVAVEYAVRMDAFYRMGNKPWSFRKPFAAARSMAGNALSRFTSSGDAVKVQAHGTAHLFAVATR